MGIRQGGSWGMGNVQPDICAHPCTPQGTFESCCASINILVRIGSSAHFGKRLSPPSRTAAATPVLAPLAHARRVAARYPARMWTLALILGCAPPAPPAPPPGPPTHVGSAACRACHDDVGATWLSSAHAAAEQAGAGTVPLEGERAWNGRIGLRPLWQPLVPAADGRVQVSSLAWDVSAQRWFDVFQGDPRQPGEWGHWTGRGMTWNSACAHCHDTGVERGYQPTLDRYATTCAERGVGCEACHGPGSAHVAAPADVRPPVSAPGSDDVCLPCHTRGTPLVDLDPRLPWLDQIDPAWPDRGEVFEVDGQVRDEAFEGTAFILSTAHHAGARCVDCHEPHGASGPVDATATCARCHPDAAATHPHPPGATCVDCHMPTTTYMQVDVRHDHRLTAPDPGLALETGARTACDRCHAVDAALVARAERWWPPDAARRAAPRALAAVRGDRPLAAAQLRDALATHPDGAWRGVLLALASEVPAGPGPVTDALEDALRAGATSPDPWVRLGAARGLTPDRPAGAALDALLSDPVRAVRLTAARAAMSVRAPTDPPMAELRAWLEAHADQPAAALQLATWLHASGDAARALSWAQRAATLDPLSPDAHRALAVILAGLSRPADALTAIARARALQPGDPDLALLHALALAEAGDPRAAEHALTELVTAHPDHGRATYNLGLLQSARGASASSATLRRALVLLPDDPGPPWALATEAFRAGRRDEAAALAREALRRAPHHAEARALLAQLTGPAGPTSAAPGSPAPSTAPRRP